MTSLVDDFVRDIKYSVGKIAASLGPAIKLAAVAGAVFAGAEAVKNPEMTGQAIGNLQVGYEAGLQGAGTAGTGACRMQDGDAALCSSNIFADIGRSVGDEVRLFEQGRRQIVSQGMQP